MNYAKLLYKKGITAKSEQVAELQTALGQSEKQITLLRDTLEKEQVTHIEEHRRKAQLEVELKMKDIEIERLNRKAIKDQEHLVDNSRNLEEKLAEKVEEIRNLKEVAWIHAGTHQKDRQHQQAHQPESRAEEERRDPAKENGGFRETVLLFEKQRAANCKSAVVGQQFDSWGNGVDPFFYEWLASWG